MQPHRASSLQHRLGGSARWLAACLILPVAAWAGASEPAIPTLAELEAAGARIGQIHVVTGEIFDLTDPKEDKLLFRWANALHIRTRPAVIQQALVFKSGEALSVARIDETERLLRRIRYLYDVQIRPVAWQDGVVDLEVRTRDTWSLDPGFSAGRSGGANSSGIRIREYNLLGTGTSLSWGRSNNVDRSSNTFQFSADRILGTRTSLDFDISRNSDGRRDAVSLVRPFYALDSRWAAGLSASRDDRIDSVYDTGVVAGEFRHRQRLAEAFAGWSSGWVDGWVQRYSIGTSLIDDSYLPEPGHLAPAALPPDEKLVTPFFRYELIEDRFAKFQNRNLMARPEFFELGLAATVQVGWAGRNWGSSRDALVYAASVSRGFEPAPEHILTAAASISGQYANGRARRQRLAVQSQYYLPQGRRWLFYASAAVDTLTNPIPTETLLLGGDNGLRGYPLRYQNGQRRALFTVEERFFTDAYIWRLFRIGGAAFIDHGRAWGGNATNTINPGWLSNAGLGLRIVSVRAAFSNVLHVDLAFPLNATPDIRKVQFLVRTKTSF